MASLDFSFYMYGCPGCAVVENTTTKKPPVCIDPDCPRFGVELIPWPEIVARGNGEGWKRGEW